MAEEVTPVVDNGEVSITLTHSDSPAETAKYNVLVESGIFKNGKLYAKGETVEMTKQAGERFVALAQVEEVK